MFVLFSLGGAVFGMGEEAIAFAMVIVPVVVALGYDSIWVGTEIPVQESVGVERLLLSEDKLYTVLAVVLIVALRRSPGKNVASIKLSVDRIPSASGTVSVVSTDWLTSRRT